MPKYLFLLIYLLPTSAFTKEALKNFNESLNESIVSDVSVDEEKFRGRAPASAGDMEVEVEQNNLDLEQTVLKKSMIDSEKW